MEVKDNQYILFEDRRGITHEGKIRIVHNAAYLCQDIYDGATPDDRNKLGYKHSYWLNDPKDINWDMSLFVNLRLKESESEWIENITNDNIYEGQEVTFTMEGSKHEGKTYKGKLNVDDSYIHLCQDVHSASNIARNIHGFAYSYAFSSTKNLKDEISLSVFKYVKFKKKSGPIASIDASTADNWFQPKDWTEFEDGMEYKLTSSDENGKITIEKYHDNIHSSIFFCSNKTSGADCKDKKGFKFSHVKWHLDVDIDCGSSRYDLKNIKLKRTYHKEDLYRIIDNSRSNPMHYTPTIQESHILENPKYEDYEDGDEFEAEHVQHKSVGKIKGKVNVTKAGVIFFCQEYVEGARAENLYNFSYSQGIYHKTKQRWDSNQWDNIKLFKKSSIIDEEISIKTSKVKGKSVIPTNDWDNITIKTNKIYGRINEVQGSDLPIIKGSTRKGRAGFLS